MTATRKRPTAARKPASPRQGAKAKAAAAPKAAAHDRRPAEPSTGLPVATAVRLPDLVDCVARAIVSRTIVENAAGTVTLFAFDEGERLSEHTAPYDALVQVLDGAAEITIAGATSLVFAGQTILMPANVPHAVAAPEHFKMLLTMIRGA
jgi:quercetin dioxygenase-like cupin family protein